MLCTLLIRNKADLGWREQGQEGPTGAAAHTLATVLTSLPGAVSFAGWVLLTKRM